MSEKTHFYILLTGANSGLGLSLAHRLLADFHSLHPQHHHLTLIITTRSTSKGATTLSLLTRHVLSLHAAEQFTLAHHSVDLTNLASVSSLSKHLLVAYPYLDSVILNAGMGSFVGIDWMGCFLSLARNWVAAVTVPTYKVQDIGWVTKQEGGMEEIATVFAANVFGHYFLVHEVMRLLRGGRGRIIWTSSIEAYGWTFDTGDIQGVKARHSYESSKRLTDVLSLTSSLPSTSPFTGSFFRSGEGEEGREKARESPKMYVCHPGVCGTSIIPLNFLLFNLMILAFYIARWLGSPWHNIATHLGANAASWLALAPEDELEVMRAGMTKWGSACTRGGVEMIKPTAVEGQGDPEFEELGRECWSKMEELRKSWKVRLESAGN